MNVEVYKSKVKLTSTILAQIQEATMVDMKWALEHGTVLGYINPIKTGVRVFLIKREDGDFRKVSNYIWVCSQNEPTILYGSHSQGESAKLRKPFSTEASKIEFLETHKRIKQIALLTHIYV